MAAWLPLAHIQTQVIFQLELLAVLLFVRLFGPGIHGGTLRLFVDNEGARFGLIAGYTSNSWGARIVAQIWLKVARFDLAFWVERIPSKLNPADSTSRDRWVLQRRLPRARIEDDEVDAAVEIIEALLEGRPELCLHRRR